MRHEIIETQRHLRRGLGGLGITGGFQRDGQFRRDQRTIGIQLGRPLTIADCRTGKFDVARQDMKGFQPALSHLQPRRCRAGIEP